MAQKCATIPRFYMTRRNSLSDGVFASGQTSMPPPVHRPPHPTSNTRRAKKRSFPNSLATSHSRLATEFLVATFNQVGFESTCCKQAPYQNPRSNKNADPASIGVLSDQRGAKNLSWPPAHRGRIVILSGAKDLSLARPSGDPHGPHLPPVGARRDPSTLSYALPMTASLILGGICLRCLISRRLRVRLLSYPAFAR